jgi:hypothetical protein
MKAAIVSGVVAGLTAAAVLLAVWLLVFLAFAHGTRGHGGVVIEGGPDGPITTFTVP